MIYLGHHPADADRHPVELTVGLSDADLSALAGGTRYAIDGSGAGLEGTDLLLGYAADEADAREQLVGLAGRFAPDPADGTTRRVFASRLNDQCWMMPADTARGGVVHVVLLNPAGLAAIRSGRPVRYRTRVLPPGTAASLEQGVHPTAKVDQMIRGAALGAGSVVCEFVGGVPAGRLARAVRRAAGYDTPAGVKFFARRVREVPRPPAWLSRWDPPIR